MRGNYRGLSRAPRGGRRDQHAIWQVSWSDYKMENSNWRQDLQIDTALRFLDKFSLAHRESDNCIFKIKSINCMNFLGQTLLGYQICIENGVVLISDVLLAKGQGRKDWSWMTLGFAGKKGGGMLG